MSLPVGCSRETARPDHNGRMHRPLLVALCFAATVGGCGWDGPTAGVRVVNTAVTPGADADLDRGATGGRAAPDTSTEAGTVPPGDADDRPGLENRPGSLGAIPMPSTVAVVGDSLTVSAIDEIERALARLGVREVLIDGRESRRMASGSGALPSGVAAIEGLIDVAEPDLWVVALGTNDVGAQVEADRFRDDLRATLAAIPADVPVVWVDLWIRDRLDDVVEANTVIRTELSRRPAPSEVVDWFAHGPVDGMVTGDGIHLTDAGQTAFASAIADGVLLVALG